MTNLIADLSLGRKIGAGYFGEVYEAQDPIHGRVAVKVFHKLMDFRKQSQIK